MRKLEICILSDLHLGTYGSHAKEIVEYLNDIDPEILILNGDIIDMWQFTTRYFPNSHWQVLQCLSEKIMNGTEVYYLTGNHDDSLRKFSDLHLANFHLIDQLTLNIDGKSYWIFHGDVFDNSVSHSRWIAKLGGKAYDYLIILNRAINWFRSKLNMQPYSFSRKIKANVKNAVKHISDFEETAIELGFNKFHDYVICGHIHQAKIKEVKHEGRTLCYMNSGDWVESLTSLEYVDKEWKIYNHLDQIVEEFNEMLKEKVEMSTI